MPRTVDEHAETIRDLVSRALAGRRSHEVAVSPVALASAEGAADRHAVLAEPVVTAIDLPPFDNSQMDGYAVHSADLADGPAELRVAARIPAGRWPSPLERGWAAPIMTGAPVPPGADAVVPIERATPDSFLPETAGAAGAAGVAGAADSADSADGEAGPQDQRVLLPGPVEAGLFVRPQGSDLPRGATLFDAGVVLGAAQWGSLAAAGVEAVRVVDRPRILVVSTGEELTEPGRPLEPGLIYDANGASLAVALADAGAEVLSARVPDDADALLRVVRDALSPGGGRPGVDLVVTMGGVSAGAYEVVRDAFEPRGVAFGSVAMQPGGPQGWGELWLGELSQGDASPGDASSGDVASPARVPVVCLPGNPVSVLVSFEAFLRLPLLEAVGRRPPRRDTTARLAEGADSPVGKHQMRRARVDDDGVVHFVGGPSSHLLHSYAGSNALAHIPVGVSRVEAGDEVVVWALDD